MLGASVQQEETTDSKDMPTPSWKGLVGAAISGLALMAVITGTLTATSLALFPKYDPEAITTPTVSEQSDEPSNASDAATATGTIQEPKPVASEPPVPRTPTKLVAKYQDVDIKSPIALEDLTGILFHQASYAYGLVMDSSLPVADEPTALATNATRINYGQQQGDWLDAEALHLYRVQDSTEMDTSIDVGADPGSIVYAPVSGTVVLVTDYMLYGYIPDIEIHIRPDGRDDLDMVVIHTENPLVKAGDHVEAGVTEISHVRDIASWMTGIQLDDYDGEEHLGNHAHIQINDADYPEYRKTKLEGAIS